MLTPETIRQRVLQRLQEQRLLVQALLRLREQLQGSLFARYGVCGKPNCACRTGAKHGPYYVLSARVGGRSGFAYVEGDRLLAARERVKSYREFRSGLRRLRRLNVQLVSLLKRYQAQASRQGGRRVGFAVSA
jgi:hypothetical protein